MIPAGKLDHRIRIEKRVDPPLKDSYGEEIEQWEELATVWAHKRDARGEEKFAAQQLTGQVDAFWEMRYRDDVTNAMRIVDLRDATIHEIVTPPIVLIKYGRDRVIEIQSKKLIRGT
jgi:SPP1 family predicted phage head-tail adaptor